jgi:hypothetical protein
METFSDFDPNELDRIRWYQKGYRVICNDCWWVGLDEEHDQCPDCNSDRLEWIINDNEQYPATV